MSTPSSLGFSFTLDDVNSQGDLVAVRVTTPSGRIVELFAEVAWAGRTLILRQFAISAADATANELGISALRNMARAALEEFDVDAIRIEEARRTSGANPGRTAPTVEFRRRARKDDPDAA